MMKYDVLLTDVGSDELSVALAVMNSLQQVVPLAVLNVEQARDWLAYPPILLRRGVSGEDARDFQQRYEQLGAAIAIMPSQLYFPQKTEGITQWRNEWFSEHLVALHERILSDWAKDNQAQEVYRFSYLPTYGTDITLRLWETEEALHAIARRSIGRIGPMPGPPAQATHWQPSPSDWQRLQDAIVNHQFWESDSWNTVPEGYTIVGTNHWVMEGVRGKKYKVLVDQTPNEGAAREVGLLMLDLIPDTFPPPIIE